MNSFIASQIKEIATETILHELENGDAIEAAKNLRSEIRAGWMAALVASGMPDDMIAQLAFPL